MSTEIKKFDPAESLKSVKERIKDSFVSLIPDEQWDEMVKKEVDDYFKAREEGYGERGKSSSFTKDVHSVLSEEVKTRVKIYLSTNFSDVWFNNGVPVCNEKVEEFITKNSGKILADMIGGIFQQAIANVGYRM